MVDPIVKDGFVLNLDDDLRPIYRLNPFSTAQTSKLRATSKLTKKNVINSLLSRRFNGRPFVYTANGRQAIREALRLVGLKKQDCVTIFTSTGNQYISGCVTSEIEKFCQWSRQIERNSKVIFVNHEFGVPFPDLVQLKKYGLPIIEDCCYAFDSATPANQMAQVGEYVIYSFAKFFPIQFGGLLVGPAKKTLPTNLLDADTLEYLQKTMQCLYPLTNSIAKKRHANHNGLTQRLAHLELSPRFDFAALDGIPGVFMFVAPTIWSLPSLKEFMWSCGIHCSVFYGEQAFFIPVHQQLDKIALDYFATCLQLFAKQYSVC